MPSLKLKNPAAHILLIAFFAAVAMLPAYVSGIPGGNDQAQHFQFAWTVYDAVSHGDLYPSLAGGTNHGFGDVGLRFYPPLTYYAIAAVYFAVSDWYFASLVAFSLAFFAGGVGVYFWAKEEFEARQALIAAAVYSFAPYHLNQFYNNALFAEFFAMAVLPFCFLFLTRVCRRGKWIDVCALAAVYALLILTHLPLTILGSLAMALYGLVFLQRSTLVASFAKLFAAIASAVVLTAFYWSRWLPEMAWVKHASPEFFSTIWDYRENFLLLPDHFLKFGEDALNLWFADLMLAVMVLIAIPAIIYVLSKRVVVSRFVLAVAVVLGVAIFMTTPLSSFIWDNAWFLQKVQFPWRWMAIVSLAGSVFASIGIHKAAESLKDGGTVLLTIGLGLILAVFVFAAAFIPKGSLYTSRSDLNSRMTQIPLSEGCECWWPVWAERSSFQQTEKVEAIGRTFDVQAWSTTEKRIHIDAGAPVIVTVAAFYYPRWQATVNGANVPVEKTADGVISLAIPAEASNVELVFREPAYVKAAYVASALSWLFVLAFAVILLVKSRKAAENAAS